MDSPHRMLRQQGETMRNHFLEVYQKAQNFRRRYSLDAKNIPQKTVKDLLNKLSDMKTQSRPIECDKENINPSTGHRNVPSNSNNSGTSVMNSRNGSKKIASAFDFFDEKASIGSDPN